MSRSLTVAYRMPGNVAEERQLFDSANLVDYFEGLKAEECLWSDLRRQWQDIPRSLAKPRPYFQSLTHARRWLLPDEVSTVAWVLSEAADYAEKRILEAFEEQRPVEALRALAGFLASLGSGGFRAKITIGETE